MSIRKRRGATTRRPAGARLPAPTFWKPGLRWLGLLMALAAVGVAGHDASRRLFDPDAFPLRHVQLDGQLRNLNEADLQRVVRAYLGQNFFRLDIDALQTAFAAEPWIATVSVRRQWPDTLAIRFEERVAFGHWGAAEMVDVNGERFRPTTLRQPGPWPLLAGPDGHEAALIQIWGEVSAQLQPLGLQLAQLLQDERRAWTLRLADGLEVYLGREQLHQRLQRFVALYPDVLAGRADTVGAVDLRYTHGFAVRQTTPATPAPAAATLAGGRPPAAGKPRPGNKAG